MIDPLGGEGGMREMNFVGSAARMDPMGASIKSSCYCSIWGSQYYYVDVGLGDV